MKSIPSALLGMLMLMVCACGNQGKDSTGILLDKDSTGILQGKDSTGILQDKDSMVIIAVNTPNNVGYFADSTGTFLFNKQFEKAYKFSEGLAPVKQNGKYGFINTKGEVVIPCIYDGAADFSEGLAMVKQNYKGSIINKEGKVIVAECDQLETHWSKVEME